MWAIFPDNFNIFYHFPLDFPTKLAIVRNIEFSCRRNTIFSNTKTSSRRGKMRGKIPMHNRHKKSDDCKLKIFHFTLSAILFFWKITILSPFFEPNQCWNIKVFHSGKSNLLWGKNLILKWFDSRRVVECEGRSVEPKTAFSTWYSTTSHRCRLSTHWRVFCC